MTQTRRDFLAAGALGALGAALPLAAQGNAQSGTQTPAVPANQQTPGAPTAFGTAPPVGPPVNDATFAEAEKLVQIEMSPADRAQAAGNWRQAMAPLYERRTGPRKMMLEEGLAPGRELLHSQFRSARNPARQRQRHRVFFSSAAFALDSVAPDHF